MLRQLWYEMSIEKAVPIAQKFVSEAQERGTRCNWDRTAGVWVDSVAALS